MTCHTAIKWYNPTRNRTRTYYSVSIWGTLEQCCIIESTVSWCFKYNLKESRLDKSLGSQLQNLVHYCGQLFRCLCPCFWLHVFLLFVPSDLQRIWFAKLKCTSCNIPTSSWWLLWYLNNITTASSLSLWSTAGWTTSLKTITLVLLLCHHSDYNDIIQGVPEKIHNV